MNVHWLARMAESGQVPGLDGFLVSAPACSDVDVPEAPADVITQSAGEEDTRMRVPSSKSPSPMKSLQNCHSNGSSSSRLSLSPVKIDHDATKALQESITSLLGKRPSPEGEDLAGGGANGADIPNGRNGKRARPQRSKVN